MRIEEYKREDENKISLSPMMPSETLISHLKPLVNPLPAKSSSKWLQRLRSSRGFPDSDHIDLEHFLIASRENTDPSEDANNVISQKSHDNNNNNNNDNRRDSVNSVLSDLFYMGDSEDQSRIKRKKTCRKQPCPRLCDVSNDSDVRKVSAPRKSRALSSRCRVKEVEEERVDPDLSAYSQTEVTVIDTSVPCWKFEKVLYRSKNVWKVGDKKGKGLMSGDGKKRKKSLVESVGGVQKKKKNKKKKLKKLKNKLKLCGSSKYADEEEYTDPSKSDQGYEQGKMVTGNEKKRVNCSQVQEKSSNKKQTDEGLSVILIKSIPTTSKKNVSGVSNSCVKSMQR